MRLLFGLRYIRFSLQAMLWLYPIPIKGIGQVLIVRVKMGGIQKY